MVGEFVEGAGVRLQSAVIYTVLFPDAQPALAVTVPDDGITTELSDKSIRVALHEPPLIEAPPETSKRNLLAVLEIEIVRVSPGL